VPLNLIVDSAENAEMQKGKKVQMKMQKTQT
jgi:hypothetical protein